MSKQENERDRKGRFLLGNQAALKHGAWSLAKARIPSVRGVRKLNKELEGIRESLEKLTPQLNVKKQLLISQIVRTEGQIRLIEMYLRKAGILRPDKLRRGILDLQPSLANSYLAFLNVQRHAIMALGLDNDKASEILAPYEIVEEQKDDNNRRNKR